MFDLVKIFSSPAKVSVLRTLYAQTNPLPLRHVAYLSNQPLFSVQRALAQLVEDKLITRQKNKRYVLFQLNKQAPAFNMIKDIFSREAKEIIKLRAQTYHKKAQSMLDFMSGAYELFRKVKKV